MVKRLLLPSLCLALVLSACTTTGKLATKANGPIDPAVTFKNVCSGAKIADGLFGAAVKVAAGKISEDDVKIEHDIYAGVQVICNGPVPVDLNGAILAIMADSTQIGALVAKYTKTDTSTDNVNP